MVQYTNIVTKKKVAKQCVVVEAPRRRRKSGKYEPGLCDIHHGAFDLFHRLAFFDDKKEILLLIDSHDCDKEFEISATATTDASGDVSPYQYAVIFDVPLSPFGTQVTTPFAISSSRVLYNYCCARDLLMAAFSDTSLLQRATKRLAPLLCAEQVAGLSGARTDARPAIALLAALSKFVDGETSLAIVKHLRCAVPVPVGEITYSIEWCGPDGTHALFTEACAAMQRDVVAKDLAGETFDEANQTTLFKVNKLVVDDWAAQRYALASARARRGGAVAQKREHPDDDQDQPPKVPRIMGLVEVIEAPVADSDGAPSDAAQDGPAVEESVAPAEEHKAASPVAEPMPTVVEETVVVEPALDPHHLITFVDEPSPISLRSSNAALLPETETLSSSIIIMEQEASPVADEPTEAVGMELDLLFGAGDAPAVEQDAPEEPMFVRPAPPPGLFESANDRDVVLFSPDSSLPTAIDSIACLLHDMCLFGACESPESMHCARDQCYAFPPPCIYKPYTVDHVDYMYLRLFTIGTETHFTLVNFEGNVIVKSEFDRICGKFQDAIASQQWIDEPLHAAYLHQFMGVSQQYVVDHLALFAPVPFTMPLADIKASTAPTSSTTPPPVPLASLAITPEVSLSTVEVAVRRLSKRSRIEGPVRASTAGGAYGNCAIEYLMSNKPNSTFMDVTRFDGVVQVRDALRLAQQTSGKDTAHVVALNAKLAEFIAMGKSLVHDADRIRKITTDSPMKF